MSESKTHAAEGEASSPDILKARLAGLTACVPGFAFLRRQHPDSSLTYDWFSDSVHQVLGFTPDEMGVNQAGCLHVVHWADRDSHLQAVLSSAADMTPCEESFRAITKDGEVRWLQGRSIPRRQGTQVVWDGVLVDVTQGRRAEFRLDMLMEHAADSILVLDEAGVIDSANTSAEHLFGQSARDLTGKSIADLIEQDTETQICLASVSDGQPHEFVGIRQNGERFPLELSTNEVRMEGRRLFVGIGRDITDRKATENALLESEQRMRAIAGNMPGMVFQRVLSPDGVMRFTYVSEGCRTFLGVDPEELLAEPELFLQCMSADEQSLFMAALTRSAETLEPLDEEMAVFGGGRRRRWLRGQSRPNRRPNGDVVWDGVMIDVTEKKTAEQRLSFLAYYDPLTRLPNRTAFLERFTAARENALRAHQLLAVLSLGIDRFGIINATMGHSVGDQVLTAAADIVQAGLSRNDVMARASGDRFLILLAGHTSRRELTEAVERIHAMAQSAVHVAGDEFEVSTSVGVALYPRDGEDVETLIKNAEAALQRAKSQGPATLQFFTKEMSARASKTLSLQNKLRRALEQGEFVPYFQPQVDLNTGIIVGMEALVRWNNPEMGMVSPGEFIPVAEESGLIDGICESMLSQCARQNKAWQDAGFLPIPVAVNVSGRQFQYARRLITALETTLAETSLDPRYLEVELTESSAMRDADNAIAVVQTLKDMGISCSIDDFGTGYSSLSVLKRFPISKLKIDRSFVMDVITDPNDAAIVDAIVAMAKALNMKVVAEGVEHTQHLDFLRDIGCDQMQGYLFSRPLPAEEMGQMLAEGRRLPITSVQRGSKIRH
ncbi:MAG: EAL domain-containing protein [Magnetospirillum gryphiswaldense]|nr:EAL domain-containing protein [Magnetospirillum gryphiswaldense]